MARYSDIKSLAEAPTGRTHILVIKQSLHNIRLYHQALRCCFAGLTPSAWSSKARKDTRKILTDCESILCEVRTDSFLMIIQFVKFVILWHGVHTKIHLFQVRDQEPPDDLSHCKFKVVLRGADLKALNVNIPIITSSGMGNTLSIQIVQHKG